MQAESDKHIMDENFAIQLFEGKRVRIVWDEEQEKYYFSVVDIVQVLTDSADYQTARKYWKVLKGRLIKEGNETVTNCYQLKLPAADGKKRLTIKTRSRFKYYTILQSAFRCAFFCAFGRNISKKDQAVPKSLVCAKFAQP